MGLGWSRRAFLGTMAAGGLQLAATPVLAQGGGVLERLRAAKTVKVAIANSPPYSMLNPDGTLGGVAPHLTRVILQRLGVPKMEGVSVSYGELIPGLMAGRWDMIAAALTITKARCEQVAYSDPFLVDGAAFAYLPKDLPNPPRNFKEAGERLDRIGLVVGAAVLPLTQAAVAAGRKGAVTQFPDISALMDALYTGRIQIVINSNVALTQMKATRKDPFEIVYPLPDDIPHGSGPAFRPQDKDLIDPFRREFLAMKQSGEAQKILAEYGFTLEGEDAKLTAEAACARAG